MERFTTCRHLALVAVIRNLAVYQRFTMIDATGTSHVRVLQVFCNHGVVPQFTGLVG